MAVCKASPCHPEFLWSLFVWHDAFLAVVSLRAIGGGTVITGSGAQSCREPRHASSRSPSASRDRVGHVCEGTACPLLLKTDSPGPYQHISCMAWRSNVPMVSLALAACAAVADALAQ